MFPFQVSSNLILFFLATTCFQGCIISSGPKDGDVKRVYPTVPLPILSVERSNTRRIEGSVFIESSDLYKQPLRFVDVALLDVKGKVRRVPSDEKGNFSIVETIPQGDYKIVLVDSVFAGATDVKIDRLEVKGITLKAFKIPKYLYKILPKDLWTKSESGKPIPRDKNDDAFIHLAEGEDVERIRTKFYYDQKVVTLKLDSKKLQGTLVKEKNPGGSKEYFHLYNGSLPHTAIVDVIE